MNCENFNGRLPEYLEDTLSAAEQAAAREHAQKCRSCQQAVAQQEALAKSIRFSLNRETEQLFLRPETRRNVLNAMKRQELPPTAWENIQAFWAILWRHPAWAGTALLCLGLVISGRRFYMDAAKHSFARASTTDDRITYAIDVPIQTETHVYRRQNNMVVDAIVSEISLIDASFSENRRLFPSSPSPINK